MEPEIGHLADFLVKAGAEIKGAGGPTIEIIGRGRRLDNARGVFETIPDRIEAGSFLILGAALGKGLEIKNANPEHLASLVSALQAAGANVSISPRGIRISRPRRLFACDIKTREYPGFVTDLQAPFSVLMTQAQGESLIFETVFDGRLNYIEELNRMGARITPCDPHRILIHGPTKLRGREIESPDIRAGLAFVIAGLLARGQSRIKNVYQIDRGYEKIEQRLQKLGADIKRV
jgi:UDP-N-acetylglucosamine 1-carboxyvinyltransferase